MNDSYDPRNSNPIDKSDRDSKSEYTANVQLKRNIKVYISGQHGRMELLTRRTVCKN